MTQEFATAVFGLFLENWIARKEEKNMELTYMVIVTISYFRLLVQ